MKHGRRGLHERRHEELGLERLDDGLEVAGVEVAEAALLLGFGIEGLDYADAGEVLVHARDEE